MGGNNGYDKNPGVAPEPGVKYEITGGLTFCSLVPEGKSLVRLIKRESDMLI